MLVGGVGLIWGNNESLDKTNRYGVIFIEGFFFSHMYEMPSAQTLNCRNKMKNATTLLSGFRSSTLADIDILNLLRYLRKKIDIAVPWIETASLWPTCAPSNNGDYFQVL